MAWWLLPAAVQLGLSWSQGQSQKNAASAQNALAEKQAEQRFERANKEWAIDYQTGVTNYTWKLAETEAARFMDRQKKADYELRQSQVIDSAIKNLEVNQQALSDKYIVSEGLRATQEGLAFDYKMDTLTADSSENLRQYMMAIQMKGLEAQTLLKSTQTEGERLQIDIVNGYAEEAIQRDIDSVAGLVASSIDRTKGVVRSGGSSTGQRQALNALQSLGRSYGQMQQRNQSRQTRLGVFNSSMQGEVASKMGEYALAMQDNVGRMKYTNNKYRRDGQNTLDVFQQLTIPSFPLAARQGAREVESLFINTQEKIDQASMPYREAIIFDPLEPIAGLKPEYYAPTKVYEPSGLDVALGAIQGGVQGALSASYTKADGSLGFF